MSGISIPQTPTPEPEVPSGAAPPGHAGDSDSSQGSDAQYSSPPPHATSDLTPPPSTQIPAPVSKSARADSFSTRDPLLASPPETLKTGPSIYPAGLFGEIPSVESVRNFDEEQLRSLVAELLPALGEARMSAAHAKLQYSLLSIENSESVKRAEVEHEMTRREVQVLQECSQIQRGGKGYVMSPCSPQSSTQRHLDLALKHCRELQADNSVLERRLQQAKKLIMQLDGKNAELMEDVHLLRQRIKQNRDHLDAMRSSGAISVNGTPAIDFTSPLHKSTPRTPKSSRTTLGAKNHVGSQDPFDALLFAGQVLNAETNSVPSTPSRARSKKLPSAHVRGAHSLSSLPVTPNRSRPITADGALFTPVNRLAAEPRTSFSAPTTQLSYNEEDHRDDRDSTISASDVEEEPFTDYDVPASQASQRAASMLRRTSTKNSDGAAPTGRTGLSKGTKQAKIYGQLRKVGTEKHEPLKKRGNDVNTHDEIVRSNKKSKVGGGFSTKVGLGIASWPSPGR
ncbi:hypothetical protein MMC07_006083 [Pseudocyphellaria aurata]|nr:hypothetical protein [Pseudocyphellaria aurata]